MFLHSQRHQQVHTGDSRRSRAGDHHPHIGEILLNHPQTVEDRRGADNRRAVLIVVEHRNIHALTQFLLNVETFRRFNIFEVDAAKRRLQGGNDINEFVRIQLINFNIEHIDTGELFKQNALSFHYRFSGQRADIA